MIKKINGLVLTIVLAGSLLGSGIPFAFAEDASSNSSMRRSVSISPATDVRRENRRINRREDRRIGRRSDNESEIRSGTGRRRVSLFSRTSNRRNDDESEVRSGARRTRVSLFSGSSRRGRRSGDDNSIEDSRRSGRRESGRALFRRRASLTGIAIDGVVPTGNADFRLLPRDRGERITVGVHNVNLPSGTILTVNGCGAENIGTITLNSFRGGELNLKERNGDTVPTCVSGSAISVLNGTTTILSKNF